jgi:hypothetical protein
MASNSHFGIANAAFLAHRPERRLEAMYRYNVPEDRFRRAAYDVYVQFVRTQASPEQRKFDNTDYPVIAANLGCILDNNPADH